MVAFILRRIALLVPVLFGVSLVVFILIHMIPGDATLAAIGVNTRITPEQRALIRKSYGLDDSEPVQYVKWMQHVLKGDLGKSLRTKRPLTTELKLRLPVTFELALIAGLMGAIPAIALGVLSRRCVATRGWITSRRSSPWSASRCRTFCSRHCWS